MENVENTRAEGHFARETPKNTPKTPGTPKNTRQEGISAKAREREHMEKITYILKYMQTACTTPKCTDEELKNMAEAAECLKWKFEEIQRIRKEAWK